MAKVEKIEVALLKGNKKIKLSNPLHIKAYKNAGWKLANKKDESNED